MARTRVVAVEAWVDAAADALRDAVCAAVAARGRCHLALAGGGTPGPVYAALADRSVPWEAIEIWFGDERCVPPDHADSTFAMVRGRLLERVEVVVHRMRGEDPDREAAARDYAMALPERLDVVVLGMGGDGHTASLFPGQSPEGRVAVVNGPKPPPWRLTLTESTLRAARERVVLVCGAAKAEMVARAFREPVGRYPIQLALDGLWILDTEAAAQLQEAPWPRSE